MGIHNPWFRSIVSSRSLYKHPSFRLSERSSGHWNRRGLGLHVTRCTGCRKTAGRRSLNSFNSFIHVFGQTLGAGVGGVVFPNQFRKKLSKYPLLAPSAMKYSKDFTVVVGIIKEMEPGIEKTQLVPASTDSLTVI